MNEELEIQAEVLKLAQLLGSDAASLSYLEQVPVGDLRALREQVTEVLFTAHETVFKRLATASSLLPVGLVASLGEHTFGAILSARITGALDPARAVEIAARMPTSFLADVAIELDPRRATAVIAGIPPRRIFEITSELSLRGEYVTMGRFVGQLGDEALSAAFDALDDDALVRTAFVTEDRLRPDRLARVLEHERVERLLALTTEEDWPELRDLLAQPRP